MALGTDGLTDRTPNYEQSVPGMAYFSGTGPPGTTCDNCVFFKIETESHSRGSCLKYVEFTGKIGPKFYRYKSSCKYFENK